MGRQETMDVTEVRADADDRGQPDRRPSGAGRRGGALHATALRRLASWPIWGLSAAVFVSFALVFFASSAPFAIPTVEAACGQAPLDMRFAPTANEVEEFLTACGQQGRDAYRNLQLADLVYPAVVGLFLASSLALGAERLRPGRDRAALIAAIPLLASGFDYLENLFAWLALTSHPEPAATNGLLGLASAAKTSLSWLAGLLLVVIVGALFVGWLRQRLAGVRRSS